jgi:hypothetical protein
LMLEHKQWTSAEFPENDGELEIGIGNDGKLVHIKFGAEIARFAMHPDKALATAVMLTDHALAIKQGK